MQREWCGDLGARGGALLWIFWLGPVRDINYHELTHACNKKIINSSYQSPRPFQESD